MGQGTLSKQIYYDQQAFDQDPQSPQVVDVEKITGHLDVIKKYSTAKSSEEVVADLLPTLHAVAPDGMDTYHFSVSVLQMIKEVKARVALDSGNVLKLKLYRNEGEYGTYYCDEMRIVLYRSLRAAFSATGSQIMIPPSALHDLVTKIVRANMFSKAESHESIDYEDVYISKDFKSFYILKFRATVHSTVEDAEGYPWYGMTYAIESASEKVLSLKELSEINLRLRNGDRVTRASSTEITLIPSIKLSAPTGMTRCVGKDGKSKLVRISNKTDNNASGIV